MGLVENPVLHLCVLLQVVAVPHVLVLFWVGGVLNKLVLLQVGPGCHV